jgi:spore coat protein U-like protein
MIMKVARITLILLYLLLPVNILSAACTISTTPVNFGSYDVFSASPADSTGLISITCNETPAPYAPVSIGPSPNSGGFNPRKMRLTSGTDLLNYNLYTNATRTSIWGDGTSGTVRVWRTFKKNVPQNLIVYGRIPPGQDVRAGTYTDTLTVTLIW